MKQKKLWANVYHDKGKLFFGNRRFKTKQEAMGNSGRKRIKTVEVRR